MHTSEEEMNTDIQETAMEGEETNPDQYELTPEEEQQRAIAKFKEDLNPNIQEVIMKKGVSNPEYRTPEIDEGLKEDINTLEKVFDIFNKEMFHDELEKPVIATSESMRKDIKITALDAWEKTKVDDALGKEIEERSIGLYISEKLLSMDFKDVCVILLQAMIMQYDEEKYEQYKSSSGGKQSEYKRMVTNEGNYFSKKYALKCKECGLNAEVILKENKKGELRPSGKYKVTAGEKFDQVFKDYHLDQCRFVTKKLEQDKNRQSMRVYKCPKCGLKIRLTRYTDATICCFATPMCWGARFEMEIKPKNDTQEEDSTQ